MQTALSLVLANAGPASQCTLRTTLLGQMMPQSAATDRTALAKCWSVLLGRGLSRRASLVVAFADGRLRGCSCTIQHFAAPCASHTGVCVCDDIVVHMGARDSEGILQHSLPSCATLQRLHSCLVSQGALPSDEHAGPVGSSPHDTKQHFLTASIHRNNYRALKVTMGDDGVDCLRSTGLPAAGPF